MDEPTRYDENHYAGQPTITEHENGRFVLHTDYAALLAERDRLAGQVAKLIERFVSPDYRTASCGCEWSNGSHGNTCPEHGIEAISRESAVAALLEGK